MKWVIIILIVLAVVLAAALIWTAMKRKKHQVARERAGELRSEAANTAAAKQEQEARAREAQAEADRVRAQADKLEARAQEERTSYDMTRATQEDRLREADRLDPDVDHRAPDYQPGVGGTHRSEGQEVHPDGSPTSGSQATGSSTRNQHSAATPNPAPSGPETGVSAQEQAAWEREQARRDQT
jgi:hypothetical protein